jgi:hypothetical protein
MPHKDANPETAVEPEAQPAVEWEVQPAVGSTPHSQRGIAKVLERAIAPDLVPPAVKLGKRQIDTAAYISELAGIARHQGSRVAAGASVPGITPQET